MTNIERALRNTVALSANVKVYVPSTVRISENADNQAMADYASRLMGQWFGGATQHTALGTWERKDNGQLVHEKVTIVESYARTEQLEEHIMDVLSLAEEIKEELEQEAVSIEVNNTMYMVE